MMESTVSSEDVSQFTIVAPREIDDDSCRILTDFYGVLICTEKDRWENRKHFFVATLLFCFNLGNLWRFPRQMLIHGQACFVYIYIFCVLVFGTSLLFLEVALGQYAGRGLSKVFSICPIFEGITFSMALYSVVVNIVNNHWNIFNIRYFIYGLSSHVPFKPGLDKLTNETLERVFFRRHVVQLTDNDQVIGFNYENFALLFLIWGIIVIVGIKRTYKNPHVTLVICCLTIFTMIFLLVIVRLTFPRGTQEALTLMFIPRLHDITLQQTWCYAVEQSLVAVGVGIGPLIVFGSFSKFSSPAHVDCFLINLITLFVTLSFAASIVIITGGLADEAEVSLQEYLVAHFANYSDIQIHVLISQLIDRTPNGLAQVLMVTVYLTFFSISLCCGTHYMKTLYHLLCSTILVGKRHRVNSILVACVVSFGLAFFILPSKSFYIHDAMDNVLVGLPVLIILFCEVVAVAYIYTVHSFCDDIEFMLGLVPNFYFQISWILSPIVLGTFSVLSIVDRFSQQSGNALHFILCVLVLVITLAPIVIVGFLRIMSSVKSGKLRDVLGKRPSSESSVDRDSLGSFTRYLTADERTYA